MKVRVEYTRKALKDLQKLDRSTAKHIVERIAFYTKQKKSLKHAKKLKPPFDDLYRFRIGNCRAIFEIDTKGQVTLLTILKVDHRKNVYE